MAPLPLPNLQNSSKVLLALRDLVAPARCMLCLREDTWLCSSCRRHLTKPIAACIVCNQETTHGRTCADCAAVTPIAGTISAGLYSHAVFRRGISWLKFKGVRAIADDLASLVIPHLPLIAPLPYLAKNATLVPIPLHQHRRRERGFNQSHDIAHAISKYTTIPVTDGLVRSRHTWAQSRLPRNMRAENTDNAFTATQELTHNIVILIDDVVTSGATLTSAAQALQPFVPQSSTIWVVTIARG